MNWLILLSLILFFSYIDIITRSQVIYFILFILYMSFGFRYKLGSDYDTYYSFFNDPNYHELGFQAFIVSLKTLGFSSQAQFLFIHLFRMSIIFIILRKSKYRSIGLIIYLTLPYFALREFSNIRQVISENIFLISLYMYTRKKQKKYFLINLLGLYFHSSILLVFFYIFAIFIKIDKIDTKKKILIGLILLLLGNKIYLLLEIPFRILEFIGLGKYRYYVELGAELFPKLVNSSIGSKITFIMTVLLYFITVICEDKIDRNKYDHYYSIYILGSWFYFASSNLPYPVARISYYGLIGILFIFPHLYARIELKSFKKLNIFVFIVLLFCSTNLMRITKKFTNVSFDNVALKYNFNLID